MDKEKKEQQALLRARRMLQASLGKHDAEPTHISEFSKAAVSAFGGMSAFAKEVVARYHASESEHVKARLMQMVVGAVVADTQISGKVNNVDDLEETDILNSLRDILGEDAVDELLKDAPEKENPLPGPGDPA